MGTIIVGLKDSKNKPFLGSASFLIHPRQFWVRFGKASIRPTLSALWTLISMNTVTSPARALEEGCVHHIRTVVSHCYPCVQA